MSSLIISDACVGLVEAAAERDTKAQWQRCVVLWYRNVFSRVPRAKLDAVARWRVSAKGNQWIRADGFRVTVYGRGNRWGATVASEDDNFVRHLRRVFRTANEAKLATFDLISRLLASQATLI